MTQALITPSIIEWAIQRAQISIDVLSEKLHYKPERIEAWIDGRQKPTFKQAQNIAKVLHIPFGYLFLSNPPEESLPLPDLRTIADREPINITPEFRDLLNDVKRKQEWYKEYAIENNEQKFEYLGKFNIDSNVKDVAQSILNALDLNSTIRAKCRTRDDYLKMLTQKIELLGILVMRNSIVGSNTHRPLSVQEFRGFAISDEYAPLIFLNSSDANNAKIFTLAHELAHLWINQSGISVVDLHELSSNDTEKFCNAVAAEILVPEDEFKKIWKAGLLIEDNSSYAADIFKVSNFVTARRALDLGLITRTDFFEYYNLESERFEENRVYTKAHNKGGGSYYSNIQARNGRRFSRAVVVAALEGKVPYREAATLVNIKASNMSEFAKTVGVK